MRLTWRLVLVPVVAVLAGLTAPAAEPAMGASQPPAAPVLSTPTSNRCANAGHQNPCWAFTQRDGILLDPLVLAVALHRIAWPAQAVHRGAAWGPASLVGGSVAESVLDSVSGSSVAWSSEGGCR
jgi:hypothetical protein